MSAKANAPISVSIHLAGNPDLKPQFFSTVQNNSGEEISLVDPKATRAMVALMDMQAVMGGAASHWGGPAAFAELMSALYGYSFHQSQKQKVQWYEKFHLINDAGHCENGIYALKANYGYADLTLDKLKGFRSIDSQLTGHGEAHIFPEAVYLSNGPLGSSLPQAQGLALADQMKGQQRTTVVAISDGACMEGEAREALASLPGFAANGLLAPFVMVISDNNTKLSGRITEESFSMEPTFQSLESLGWKVIPLEKGNDLQACYEAVEKAMQWAEKNPHQPVALHAKTIKGYGVKKTEESASGGHGFPLKTALELESFLKEIYSGEEIPQEFLSWQKELVDQHQKAQVQKKSGSSEVSEKVQVGISAAMIKKYKQGLPVISITSDLPGSTGVADFRKAHPEASLDVGIAESNMVSVAAGFSKEGYIPVVDTFAQFGVTKGALPLTMAALSEAPVIAIFSHTGFQDAADGASHQALSYFAMTASLPYTDVHCLSCSHEAEELLEQAIDHFVQERKKDQVPRNQIFFLGRENFPQRLLHPSTPYQLGKAQVLWDHVKDHPLSITLVATGPMVYAALEAATMLEAKGVGAVVVNPSCVSTIDIATLKPLVEKTQGRVLTIEDHQVTGGMGALVTHALAQSQLPRLNVKSLGVKGEFGQSAYKASQLYEKHGLTAKDIVQIVENEYN